MANKFSHHYKRGQAILVSVVFLTVISSVVVGGLVTPTVKSLGEANQLVDSRASYYTAEAGVEDALYRLKNGLDVPDTNTVSLNGGTATIVVDEAGDTRTVMATGEVEDLYRRVAVSVSTGSGNSFFYGVQAGNGGFVLQGGSQVNGNVYSNGSIVSTNGERITGSAVAANLPSPTANQSNITPSIPLLFIDFGNTSATQDFGQSFQVSQDITLNKIKVYIKKTGAPGNLTARIAYDNGGKPSTASLDSATLSSALVTGSYGWVEVSFANYVPLSQGNTYWLVLDGGNNLTKYYTIASSADYTNGGAKVGRLDTGSWINLNPIGLDGYFEIYGGGGNNSIGGGSWVGATRIGTTVNDIAWAHTVSGAQVSGPLYCQAGTNNSKVCDTSRADPAPADYPISDANIQAWKDGVTAAIPTSGGWVYNGNLTINYAGTTTSSLRKINGNLTVSCSSAPALFGPMEVTGNITVGSGCAFKPTELKVGGNLDVAGGSVMTMRGNTWVVGTVSVSGGAAVRLDASYGADSGVLVADDRISVSGAGTFSGSGQSSSYPMLLTTSNCPYGVNCSGNNALSLSGGAGAVVLVAKDGVLSVNGGSAARSLVAYKITLTGGASITYEVGLANLNFSSGPSGGWEISSWSETE